MYFKSKKISLLILGVTALVCSRTMFVFFDDPEGPNLLIVTVMAAVLYFPSLAIYSKSMLRRFSFASLTGLQRLLLAIFVQMIMVTVFYFFLSKN